MEQHKIHIVSKNDDNIKTPYKKKIKKYINISNKA